MVSAWSIPQAKRQFLKSSCPPGPGQYNLNKGYYQVLKLNPKYSIGKSNRILTNEETPAPGQYQYKPILGYEGPKYHIGEKRNLNFDDKEKLKQPGPSDYSPNKILKQSPKYSIQQKHTLPTIMDKLKVPGPGQYNINKSTLKDHTQALLGYQKRDLLFVTNKEFPGPGDYEINKSNIITLKNQPKYTIGNQERNQLSSQKSMLPGVGQYSIQTYDKIKGGHIGTYKNDNQNNSNSPGPGDYQVKDIQKNAKHVIFGKTQRHFNVINNTPGPQQYKIINSGSYTAKNNNSSQFQNTNYESGPGPQSYKIKDVWNTKKGVFISAKYDSGDKDKVPGPSDYNPNYDFIKNNQAKYS
ncbi:hypothetical protein IMG5_102470, partial [Ichthyophthirius multifiliis]